MQGGHNHEAALVCVFASVSCTWDVRQVSDIRQVNWLPPSSIGSHLTTADQQFDGGWYSPRLSHSTYNTSCWCGMHALTKTKLTVSKTTLGSITKTQNSTIDFSPLTEVLNADGVC